MTERQVCGAAEGLQNQSERYGRADLTISALLQISADLSMCRSNPFLIPCEVGISPTEGIAMRLRPTNRGSAERQSKWDSVRIREHYPP